MSSQPPAIGGYVIRVTTPASPRRPSEVLYPVAIAGRRSAYAALRAHVGARGQRQVRLKIVKSISASDLGYYWLTSGAIGNGSPG